MGSVEDESVVVAQKLEEQEKVEREIDMICKKYKGIRAANDFHNRWKKTLTRENQTCLNTSSLLRL